MRCLSGPCLGVVNFAGVIVGLGRFPSPMVLVWRSWVEGSR